MSKVYQRTENGSTTVVSVREALAEANTAMMEGRRAVRTMSSVKGLHTIEYKDGRKVRLTEVDEPAELRDWRGTKSAFNNLHRFADDKARCNRSIRPLYATEADQATAFRTKAEVLAGEYADLYTFCPRCDAKTV